MRQNEDENALHKFVTKYKPKCFYWEYILFIRRIGIAFFAVTTNTNVSAMLFVVFVPIFLLIHAGYQLYKPQSGNEIEVLLLCLIFDIVANPLSSSTNTGF